MIQMQDLSLDIRMLISLLIFWNLVLSYFIMRLQDITHKAGK